jgi:hypothetical protein
MRRYRLPAIPDPHISRFTAAFGAIMCRDATLPGSGIATHRIITTLALTEILSPTVPIRRNNYGLTLL